MMNAMMVEMVISTLNSIFEGTKTARYRTIEIERPGFESVVRIPPNLSASYYSSGGSNA